MFYGTKEFTYSNLNYWDVSNVGDMDYMFTDSAFEGMVAEWNVSSVTSMTGMFQG